jgi:hypothetical protein
MKAVLATFALGLVIFAVVGALTLGKAPARLVAVGAPGTRIVSPTGINPIEVTSGSPTFCQAGEVLPAGVSAIRVGMWAFFGARIHVMAYQGSTLLTQGFHDANWTGTSVTVPVRPLSHSASQVKLCAKIGPNSEPLILLGSKTPSSQAAVLTELPTPALDLNPSAASVLSGRVAVEYLAPGHDSWWSQLLPLARRLGLGRAYSGTWIALLIAALMLAVGVLAVRLTLKELP